MIIRHSLQGTDHTDQQKIKKLAGGTGVGTAAAEFNGDLSEIKARLREILDFLDRPETHELDHLWIYIDGKKDTPADHEVHGS